MSEVSSIAPEHKRARCGQCLRAQSTCICALIQHVESDVEVLILQHPLEQHQAKGSALLLHRCLPNSQMHIGEEFAEDLLHGWLYANGKTPILLYPEIGTGALRQGDPCNTNDLMQLRLVVLDATWRKSRKILHRNPLLQSLPRLALQSTPTSHYAIRKAHAADQLSSMEACCYALMKLEKNAEKYNSLLQVFDAFIAQMQRQAQQHQEQ